MTIHSKTKKGTPSDHPVRVPKQNLKSPSTKPLSRTRTAPNSKVK